VTENDTITYQSWLNDLQRDLDQVREDKRELQTRVKELEFTVQYLREKINDMRHLRGDE